MTGDVRFYRMNISNVDLFLARQLSKAGRAGMIDCFRKPFAFLPSEIILISNLLYQVQDEMERDGCGSEIQRQCCKGGSCKRPRQGAWLDSSCWPLQTASSSVPPGPGARGQQSAAECCPGCCQPSHPPVQGEGCFP